MLMHGLQDLMLIEVVAPTVGTNDTLTVSLTDDYNIPSGIVSGLAGARIVGKQATAGTGKTLDDSVAISGTDLVITEGSTGFANGDVFQVALFTSLPSETAAASTA